jgi:hypothetical protein
MKKIKIYLPIFSLCFIMLLAACEKGQEPDPAPDPEEEPEEVVPEEPAQAVGVNFNGQFDFIDDDNLERTETSWVRGFIDFFQFYEDPDKLKNDQRLLKYLDLKSKGYKTILNIKWNFHNRSFPEPGSQEMKDYKAFLKLLLNEVWNKTDIIVVGNEPFIESPPAERNTSLVPFYTEMAKEVNRYREDKNHVPIYIGSFDNMYLEGKRTEGVQELLAFAKNESWLAGISLHIHHSAIEQVNTAMDYVHNKIREDQKILITEFSLMKHWRAKMEENIPEAFAEKYGRDRSEMNYQYIDFTLKNPVSREEWVDFLSNSYWFENRTKYLWNVYQRFKSYEKFHVATYAIRQSYPFNKDFTRNTDPWVLNGLYANRTVQPDPETGLDQFNYALIDEFIAIQHDDND